MATVDGPKPIAIDAGDGVTTTQLAVTALVTLASADILPGPFVNAGGLAAQLVLTCPTALVT